MLRCHILLNLREKTMAFWTLVFPLLLGIFFAVGLGGIDSAKQFSPIPVAVIPSGETNDAFKLFTEALAGEMLDPVYAAKAEANALMEAGEVFGIFDASGGTVRLTLAQSGMEGSILTAVLESYTQRAALMEAMAGEAEALSPTDTAAVFAKQKALEEAVAAAGEDAAYVAEVSLGGKEVSSVSPYYFALLAMACLYMCFLGENAARRMQANISEIGRRICASPVHRLQMLLSNALSAYIIALINITLILLFLIYAVRGVDISAHPFYAALTCAVGCFIGVTFGIFIESIGRWPQNIKSALLIGSSIFSAFLAGLMISTMKDIIEKHVPFINHINPAALIADSFYCICVYDNMDRLRGNLLRMGVISAVFLILSYLLTRRVRYDSL